MKADRIEWVVEALKSRGHKVKPDFVELILDLASGFTGKPGPAPFGQLPGERAAVERMRQLRAEGLSLRLIAERLNVEKMPTHTGAPWSKVMESVVLSRS